MKFERENLERIGKMKNKEIDIICKNRKYFIGII